jgi:hypothetical protein
MIVGKKISFDIEKEIYTQNLVDFSAKFIPLDCNIVSLQYYNDFIWIGLIENSAPYPFYVKCKPENIANEISSNLDQSEMKFLIEGKSLLNLGNGSKYGLGLLNGIGLDIGNLIYKFGWILLIIAVILIRKILKK